MSLLLLRWLVPVLGSFALCAPLAGATPFVLSAAEAESVQTGDDGGLDDDSDSSDVPGVSVLASSFLCEGPGDCGPVGDDDGASGRAVTTYGSNRARSYGAGGFEEAGESVVIDRASAVSYWSDEWTFSLAPNATSRPVELEFHIDGSWGNDGYARFLAAVGQRVFPPPEPNPEEPPPLLQPDVVNVAGVDFLSTRENIIVLPGFVLIPNPDGGDTDGSIDFDIVLSFVPTDGSEWVIQSRLDVRSDPNFLGGVRANFGSTAELVRVTVPEGMSFVSEAGASYNVVPEPGIAVLAAFAAGAAALLRRSASQP